ncbi:hypothetical protein H9P43_006823 [Blastocladiella emersonii ATCC 22665]|nr:hypothetical protein H9P43_006823 [Blastocladiella emersonii ATCC 22665]
MPVVALLKVYQTVILAKHSELLDKTVQEFIHARVVTLYGSLRWVTMIVRLDDGQRRFVEPRIFLEFDYEDGKGTMYAFNVVFGYHFQRQLNGPHDDLGYLKLTRSAAPFAMSAAAVAVAAHVVPAFSATTSAQKVLKELKMPFVRPEKGARFSGSRATAARQSHFTRFWLNPCVGRDQYHISELPGFLNSIR